MRQKYRAQRCNICPGQCALGLHKMEIRIGRKEFFHLILVFLNIYCTGRIHQTAVFGKGIRPVLQDFLLC